MLDLDAWIALNKVVLAGLRGDEEFHRGGIEVAGALGQFDGIAKQPLAERFVKARRRRRFDELLVAQLHGTVALVQVNHLAL